MDFFGDYSIEAASCHAPSFANAAAIDEDIHAPNALSVPPSPFSPRDARPSCPTAFINVSNLTREFGLQSLTPSSDLTPPTSPSYIMRSPNTPSSPLRRTSLSSTRLAPCWKRRMQRQRDIHLLSDPAHLRSISDLVAHMVKSQDQCGIIKRRDADLEPTPTIPVAEDNEVENDSASSSPRSVSSTNSNARRLSYPKGDFHCSPQRRAEIFSLSHTFKDSKVQKNRAMRRARR